MVAVAYRIPCNARSHANDHRARYRRRATHPKHADERRHTPQSEPAGVTPPPSAATRDRAAQQVRAPNTGGGVEAGIEDRPPHVQAAAARWERITELNARLTATLNGEGRTLWLALEEALHVHWLDVAVDHYQRGYAAGRAQAWLDGTLSDQASPHEKLRALSAALTDVVDRLQRPPPDTDS